MQAAAHPNRLPPQVTYSPLGCRSVVNRCSNPEMPFVWTINPYRGCEFACRYCYARYTHEFLGSTDPLDFERQIYVKQQVALALRSDLARRVVPGEPIAIGTATDPYQPAERTHGVTRGILEVFAAERGHDLAITTKSSLIRRDRELLGRIGEHNRLVVDFSLITLDRKLSRRLEPRAPTPQRRLQTMKLLRDSSVDVGLFLMPVLPGITDDFDSIRRVVAAAARAGASFVVCNCLFLRQPSRSFFFRYLENEHPDQLPAYRRAYGKSVYLSAAYRERLGARVRWAAEHNGIAYGRPAATRRPPSGQLTLAL